ncbi:MAG: SIR2 family protein [Flavobacteriales bacterium]
METKARSKANPIYHVSIAVVRRVVNNSALGKEPPKYDYLVLKDQEGEHYFLDILDRAINGRFDLSAMTKSVVAHFRLQENSEFTAREPFLQSRSGAGATAYTFLLSPDQEQVVSDLFQSGVLRDSAVWVGEAELHRYKAHWRKRQAFLFERATDSFSQPTFPAELRLNITNIVKAKNYGRLVVFAGAGVSIDSNVPGWASMVEQLRAEMEKQDATEDPLITTQRYLIERKNKEYQERIQEVLNHPQTTFNPLHELILELRPQHVITTNFDPHFEQAIKESSARYSIVKKDSDLPYAKEAALLVKMHGDFDQRNIVLTKKDYDRYSEDFPLIESFVKYAFSSSLVLFVGFSFDDPNLKQILHTVKSILGTDHQQPYLLVSGAPKKPKHLGKDVHIVTMDPEPIHRYFEEAQLPNDAGQLKRLSKTGQLVFKFLRVVHRWDLSSDAIANTGIGQQLQISFGRFKEFGAIPMSTVQKLVPLRLNKGIAVLARSNDAVYSRHEPFLLRSKNDALFRYLKNISQEGVVKFTGQNEEGGIEADQAFRLLYSSSVHSIGRANDAHPEVYRLEPQPLDVECNCMGCRYRRLEFADLLLDIESLATKSICSRDRGDLGLKQAWALFKMGQPVRSYYALEEVRIRSQQTHQHVSYYLACLNLKNLRPFLYSSRHIKQEELDQIQGSIDDLDVDRVLNELPVDREVRATLRSFRASRPLNDTRWFIHEQLEKVKEIHKGYSHGGYRTSGPVHWFKVEAAVYSLYNLVRMNFLIEDEYGDFDRIAQGYLDCMMTSFATPADYEARPKSLSEFFVLMLVEYGDTEWVTERIDELDLKRLDLDGDARDKIIGRFRNFLQSGFERQKFFGNDVLKRPLFERACESDLFARRVRRILNNHLLLLSLLDLSKDEAQEMLGLVVDFLSVSDCFGGARSHGPFLQFVDALAGKLDPNDFERMLRYALSDHIWSNDLLPDLCESIRSVAHQYKAKTGLYESVVTRCKRKDWRSRLEEMLPLHQFLVYEEQVRMKQDLNLGVSDYPEQTELLWRSYYYGLWNPTDDPDLWRNYCTRLSTEISWLKDHYIPDDGMPKDIDNFGPWNGIRHCIRMAYQHNKRATAECQLVVDQLNSKMYLWALRPEEFNYREFDYRWFLSFEDWYMDRIPWSEAMITSVEEQLEKEFVSGVAKALFRHRASSKSFA